ncbi:MAG: class I SAM-dependent methyltransferase [Microthrixaceae bacterium]
MAVTNAETHDVDVELPGSALDAARMPGHWLLARMGKTVLRPGGRELTDKLLGSLDIGRGDDVLELAPGLGSTTRLVLDRRPASYTGVDRDPDAAARVDVLAHSATARVVNASAGDTGLADASASVAFGEAYLTMQPDRLKSEIFAELHRVVAPGGRIGLHEIALRPDDIDDERAKEVKGALRSSIMVSVCPTTLSGWRGLVEDAGFEVEDIDTAPLHLLEPRRLVADEGLGGAVRFAGRVLRNPPARRRVIAMRKAMHANAASLEAFCMTARRL